MKSIRYILASITLLVYNLDVQGQANFYDTALYKITYKSIYAYDTTDFSKKFTQKVCLYVGRTYSVFRDAQYELYAEARAKVFDQMMAQMNTRDLSKPISLSPNLKNIPSSELFKKIDGNTIYKKHVLLSRDYVTEEKLSQIQWKIDPETRMFGDLKAQKAQGYFRGRKYTAWFAAQLPLRAGPWKLNGLPGVILEASDEKKEVVFSFESFERLQKKPFTVITLPERSLKITAEDFERLENLYRDDPRAFVAGIQAQEGATITVEGKRLQDFKPSSSSKKTAKSPFNNPLELSKD